MCEVRDPSRASVCPSFAVKALRLCATIRTRIKVLLECIAAKAFARRRFAELFTPTVLRNRRLAPAMIGYFGDDK